MLPALALARWALDVAPLDLDARYVDYILRTLALAAMAAAACLTLAVALGYATRTDAGPVPRAAARIATLGYAVPGAVLAVGVVTALGGIDAAWRAVSDGEGLWLQGTVFALLFGYVARFLAVAHAPVQGGLARIRPALEEAARSLGSANPRARHAPAPAAAGRWRRYGAASRVRGRHEGNADHADDAARSDGTRSRCACSR